MSEEKVAAEKDPKRISAEGESPAKGKKKSWEKPVLEDVSGKVMAQPYIRFT